MFVACRYIVKIKSTDQGGLSVTATFTITITDLIDPATSCSVSILKRYILKLRLILVLTTVE